ncbi:MAG: YggU family protein [Deltaproteobacteria bacterium]|nr:YggU family protein [Deltaproteobacteria bacterium]
MSRPEPALCTVTADGIILGLHVQPRASRNEVCGVQDNALKIRLTSPPVDGAANKLCRELLADLFHVPRSAVEIVSGENSRHKRVRVSGDPDRLNRMLEQLTTSG